jgi:hypothetical protein
MKFSLLHIAIMGLLLVSCDAPRENPLDPENPNNSFSVLSGTIRTVKVPNEPLSGVNVYWPNSNVIVETNSTGTFVIDDLRPENGYLYFEKSGYSSDSLLIEWNSRKTVSILQQWNSTPKLVSGNLTSSVENRFPDVQVYRLIIDARITDDENDVDSVFIANDELQFESNLNNVSVTVFQNQYTPTQMNLGSVDDVIGKEFDVIAKDVNGKSFNIAQLIIKRIIKDLVETITPANNEVVSDTLKLNWRRFTPGYSFSYSLSIFTNTVDPEMVWEAKNVSSDDILYEVSENFDPGNYFWVVWVIDEFGNKARSRPASFIIQ